MARRRSRGPKPHKFRNKLVLNQNPPPKSRTASPGGAGPSSSAASTRPTRSAARGAAGP